MLEVQNGGQISDEMFVARRTAVLLCFSRKLDLGALAFVAKSLFHWLRGRFMMLKRMLRIQFL